MGANLDAYEASVCFAAVGELMVSFSALNSCVDWSIEETLEIARKVIPNDLTPKMLKTDHRFSSKLLRLRSIFVGIDPADSFEADWTRWSDDVKDIQRVRDDIGHGSTELFNRHDEPGLRIENTRPNGEMISYTLSAVQVGYLSRYSSTCLSWLRAATASAGDQLGDSTPVHGMYFQYKKHQLLNLFPDYDRPWIAN